VAQRTRRRARPPWLTRLAGHSPAVYSVAFLVAAVLAAVVYSLVANHSTSSVSTQVIGFQLKARPGQVFVRYEVDKAPLAESRCTIVVYDRNEVAIGSAAPTVGPNNRNERSTEQQAWVPYRGGTPVSVSITSCRITRSQL
jgi:hypothetical protein